MKKFVSLHLVLVAVLLLAMPVSADLPSRCGPRKSGQSLPVARVDRDVGASDAPRPSAGCWVNAGCRRRSSTRSKVSVSLLGARLKSIAPAAEQALTQARCDLHNAMSTW